MDPTLHTHPVDMEGKLAATMTKLVSFYCFLVISSYLVHSQVASAFYYNGDSYPVQCSG